LVQLTRFLEMGLLESFVPALVGLKDPQLRVTDHLGVVLVVDAIVVAAAALGVWRRPRAGRCVAVFLIVYLVTMVPLGLNRISLFGVGIAQDLYYQQSVQFMFWVLVALSLSAPLRKLRTGADRRQSALDVRRPAIATIAVLLVAAYSLAYVSSVEALADSNRDAVRSSGYMTEFLRSASGVYAATGEPVDLVDLTVPGSVLSGAFFPYTRYDMFFGLMSPSVRIDQSSAEMFDISPTGTLVRESFRGLSSGDLIDATATSADGATVAPAQGAASGVACLPSGGGLSRIAVPMSNPLSLTSVGRPLYGVSVTYVEPEAASVTLLLTGPDGLTLDEAVPHQWAAGAGRDVFPLLAPTVHVLDGLVFAVPAGACITGLSVGEFVPGQ
jgi:hypothetical protein